MLKRTVSKLLLAAMVSNSVISPVAASAAAVGGHNTDVALKEYVENYIQGKQESEKEESSELVIKRFDLYGNEYLSAYQEVFMMENSNIKSIINNGGRYANSVIEKAIDGDFLTHWETGKANSASFTNEVVIAFEEARVINRLIYGARQESAKGKGFAQKVKLYASENESGDDFTLIGEGSYTGSTGDIVEIRFEPTNAKRVKFEFVEANQGWASASEFQFYTEDTVKDAMDQLFTNNAYVEVREEYADLAVLESLLEETKTHPLYEEFKDKIKLAIDIMSNAVDFEGRVIVAEQQGDRTKHTRENLQFGFGSNLQPTGIAARAGETITVYVDAEEGKPLPTLRFTQQEGSFANWDRSVSLHVGKNVITVPSVPKDNWYAYDVTKGGPVYIVNPYTEEQQGSAPIIRFEGADRFPILTADTNVEEFLTFLTEYKQKLDEDIANNPDVLDRTVIDTFEMVSDHIIFTGTTTGAYEAYITKEVDPIATVESYNNYMDGIFEFYGLDGSSLVNDPLYTRENVRLAQPFGYMYAAGSHIGVQRDVMVSMLIPFEERGGSWGLTHEIGHRMDVSMRLYGESTNNMLAMYTSAKYGDLDNRIPYESHLYKTIVSDDKLNFPSQGYFERLGVFWQLEMYYPGYWAKLNQFYRERTPALDSANREQSKMQYLVEYSSEILGLDLSDHFEALGFEVLEETRQRVSIYPKSEDNIYYLNNSAHNYTGTGFSDQVTFTLEKSTNVAENSVKLSFDVSKEGKDDLLGYEIFKDDKLVAFTANNYYVDSNVDLTVDHNYEVVPYARNLSKAEPLEKSVQEPVLSTNEKITISIHDEFDPMTYVKAYDYLGQAVDGVVVDHNVDVTKHGMYQVSYAISMNGYTIEKTVPVEVVSGFDYLSDMVWTSSALQYGSIRKNNNIKLLVNQAVQTYDKGLGIHANGEVVYDLSQYQYDKFEAMVGVDQTIKEQNISSIIFKFYVDGEEVYNSGLMKHQTEAKFVSIPVQGAKELKIIVNDGGNGNSYDHGVIAETKLTTNDKKPTLLVEEKQYEIGETIDLMSGVTAFDKEDGDLTSKVELVETDFEEDTVGRFQVTYQVVDQDGNQVVVTSTVTVYEKLNTEQSKYGLLEQLQQYNEQYKIPVVSVSNNGGNYGNSVIKNAINNNISVHWETGRPNSTSFKNEVIFDLGELQAVDKMAYAARRGGKGFARKFEVYISTEETGDDFIYAGYGSYDGSTNDVITIDLGNRMARRVKFRFVEAVQDWASIGEVSFYKKDFVAEKLLTSLFADDTKTEVASDYNTLEKLEVLRQECSSYPAISVFEADFVLAEQIIKAKFPTLTIPNSVATKLGVEIDIAGEYAANDQEDGNITDQVQVLGQVDFNKTGTYTITYVVTDRDGNKVTAERTIAVIEMDDYHYLTDYDWKSTTNSYTRPVLNQSISGRTLRLTDANGQEVAFERGIGAHSTSTIVYDLTDKEYGYFTSYVGVDRQMYNTVGSVAFQIYVDGVMQFDSGLMNSKDAMKYVEVNIFGASELKLVVTDGGNGNGSDHATWGDTKLHYVNEEKNVEVSIPDRYLREAIKETLGITTDKITVGMMYQLRTLDATGRWIESLEGLQYAKNLTEFYANGNEIVDISPIGQLEKLIKVSIVEQYIAVGMLSVKDDVVVIDESIVNEQGQRMIPKEVRIANNKGFVKNLEGSSLVSDNLIVIPAEELYSGVNSIIATYENEAGTYQSMRIYMIMN